MYTLWSVGGERLQTLAKHGEHIPEVVRGEQLVETKWRQGEKVSGMSAAMMLLLLLSTNVCLARAQKTTRSIGNSSRQTVIG